MLYQHIHWRKFVQFINEVIIGLSSEIEDPDGNLKKKSYYKKKSCVEPNANTKAKRC